MSDDSFLTALQEETRSFTEAVATEQGDWIVKGFIDVYKRVYTVSVDTKVISKVMELLLIPKLVLFGEAHGYDVVLPRAQNHYPDLSFVSKSNPAVKYAVDIKSTYRNSNGSVNKMTLGAYTGYFANRTTRSNSTFAYGDYKAHLALCVIYSQSKGVSNEQKIYLVKGIKDDLPKDYEQNKNLYETADSLEQISSVVKNFVFFVQPKYKIASTTPGSGNTKNIGAVQVLSQLLNGTGPFAALGEDVYDDYYIHYMTLKESKEQNKPRPYFNLETYLEYKRRGIEKVDQESITKALEAEQLEDAVTDAQNDETESDEE